MSDARTSAVHADLGRLLSLAVHELRTPASVVGGYLRMLQRDRDAPLGERQSRMVDEAEKACARIVALIGELSELSKIEAGTAAFADAAFDLFAIVREVAAGVHELPEREVAFDVRGDESGATVRGDAARMRAALGAFFHAIMREQPGPATVVAECRLEPGGGSPPGGSSAVVVVSRDEHVQRAYAAPRAAFDELRGGLGLALPLARRVVERHGGRVWAPAPGEGAAAPAAAIVAIPLESSTEQRR